MKKHTVIMHSDLANTIAHENLKRIVLVISGYNLSTYVINNM